MDLLIKIPYKFVGGGAFVLGCALLHIYLMSIDYVPTDLLALLGLATLVSAWLALLWMFATVFMFAPVFALSLYEVRAPGFGVMVLGLMSGVTLLLAGMVRSQGVAPWLLAAGVATFVACLVGLHRDAQRRGVSKTFLTMAAMILGGSALPLCVLVLAIIGGLPELSAQWSSWLRFSGYVALLVVLVLANACAAAFKGPLLAVWTFFAIVAASIFLVVAGWRAVPALLAERVGIRLAGTSTLMVPANTCRLITAAVWSGSQQTPVAVAASCDAEVSIVKAEVQLRWSGRMLLAVASINGVDVGKGGGRVTIPDADAQFALPPQ